MPGRQCSISVEGALEVLQPHLSQRPEILLAYLFGSFLDRGKRPIHDIDIAILVRPDMLEDMDRTLPYGYRAWMTAELGRLLRYVVDLTILNQAPPVLLRLVIGTGRLIFCRSEVERIRFEVGSLKRFADTAHLRAIKRRYMEKRVRMGLAGYVRPRPH